MLKFFFWSLLIANVLVLAFNFGLLGAWSPETHEPERINTQFKANDLRLVSASQAQQSTAMVEKKEAAPVACLEWGSFVQADLAKIEDKLKQLALGDRQTRINIQDVATHMVFIPSLGSKENADKKAAELKRLGISDFYIVQDQSNLRWGISLGVFKTEDAAKAHLQALNNKGVHSAKIGPRSVSTNKFLFQLHNLSGDEQTKLDGIKPDFPAQDVHACPAANKAAG